MQHSWAIAMSGSDPLAIARLASIKVDDVDDVDEDEDEDEDDDGEPDGNEDDDSDEDDEDDEDEDEEEEETWQVGPPDLVGSPSRSIDFTGPTA
jgi:hypothetical protein